MFNSKGVFIPVKNYKCIIDTGNACPIAVKKILYGKRETVIMRQCIAALAKVGHIEQITGGQWLFKALLAPKTIRKQSIILKTLSGVSALTTYRSTVSLKSSHTLFLGVILRYIMSLAWELGCGC